jgi:diketogulonate reductase-like aldo/keto reductase
VQKQDSVIDVGSAASGQFGSSDRDACRVASRWHLGSCITGQTSVKQLEEYLSAFSITLDEETFKEVERIHMENRCPSWAD